jgi:hypothetical protein
MNIRQLCDEDLRNEWFRLVSSKVGRTYRACMFRYNMRRVQEITHHMWLTHGVIKYEEMFAVRSCFLGGLIK